MDGRRLSSKADPLLRFGPPEQVLRFVQRRVPLQCCQFPLQSFEVYHAMVDPF